MVCWGFWQKDHHFSFLNVTTNLRSGIDLPETFISLMIQSDPFSTISLVLCQSPLAIAPFNRQSWRPYRFRNILSSSANGPNLVLATGAAASAASRYAETWNLDTVCVAGITHFNAEIININNSLYTHL